MKKMHGFTLIELMIVVAIIGVLASIALMQYQNFVVKSQVTRVLMESGELRLAVEQCLNDGTTKIGNGQNECDPRASGSNIISGASQNPEIVIAANTGVVQFPNPLTEETALTATFNNSAASIIHGKKLIWQRQKSGSWYCHSNAAEKFLPSGCKYDASL